MPAPSDYRAWQEFLRGGEEVTEVLKTMMKLLEDLSGPEDMKEEVMALEMAAAGAVGGHLASLDRSFLLALDYMIEQAEMEHDSHRRELLEVVKEQVLRQLSHEFPGPAQVVSQLVTTKEKEQRVEVMRRAVAGGGVFDTEGGGNVTIPFCSLSDIVSQSDDLIAHIEENLPIRDRRLLARLVLVREEARELMGGGILDPRNDVRGLQNLSEPEVKFISKLVAIRAGPVMEKRIRDVLEGREEGAYTPPTAVAEDDEAKRSTDLPGTSKKTSENGTARKTQAEVVRPGLFLDTVTKVIGGMYQGSASGFTVQQLEWIRRLTLEVLQQIAHA